MKIIIVSSRGVRLDSSAKMSLRCKPGTEGEIIGAITNIIAGKVKGESGKDSTSAAEIIRNSNSVSIAVGTDVLRIANQLSYLDSLAETLRGLGKDVKLVPLLDRANQRGAWDMGVHPAFLPGYKSAGDAGLGCEGIVRSALNGEFGALYLAGEDLVSDFPDGLAAREALGKVKFLIVQDMFLTETAKMANVVLPSASFVEKDGTFTNQEGRVQRLRRLLEPHGDVKADWEIFSAVGEAVAPAFGVRSVAEIFNEIKKVVPGYSDISFESLNGNGAILQLSGGIEPSTDSRDRPSGLSIQGAHKKPEDPEYPFTLITGNYLYHSGRLSMKADKLREIMSEAVAELNAEDAMSLGITE